MHQWTIKQYLLLNRTYKTPLMLIQKLGIKASLNGYIKIIRRTKTTNFSQPTLKEHYTATKTTKSILSLQSDRIMSCSLIYKIQ